jgi:DNA-3-methyladenine glycosylase II
VTKKFAPDPVHVSALVKLDPALEKLVRLAGTVEVTLQENYFESLASAIVGQQLSNRVAEVLWERLNSLAAGGVSPESILALEDEALRGIGISYAKIKYLKALADAVALGALELDKLETLPDDEVVRKLTAVKGIGPWTAEMFLIFSMGRTDVFSVGDGGLQRAVKWLYQLEEVPKKEELIKISDRWKPYRTLAALYLWRALDEKII